MTINCFPRIFIILNKHNFSESEFFQESLKGKLAFHEPVKYSRWKNIITIKK